MFFFSYAAKWRESVSLLRRLFRNHVQMLCAVLPVCRLKYPCNCVSSPSCFLVCVCFFSPSVLLFTMLPLVTIISLSIIILMHSTSPSIDALMQSLVLANTPEFSFLYTCRLCQLSDVRPCLWVVIEFLSFGPFVFVPVVCICWIDLNI